MELRLHVNHKALAQVVSGQLGRTKRRSVEVAPSTSGGRSTPRVGEESVGAHRVGLMVSRETRSRED